MNTPAPAQTQMNFGPERPVRDGTVTRYTEALKYLRIELATGPAPIYNNEFSRTFNVTANFLQLCTRLEAIAIVKGKNRGNAKTYEALPRLATLTARDICKAADELREEWKTTAVEITPVVVDPKMTLDEFEELTQKEFKQRYQPGPPTRFTYGFVQDNGDVFCNHRDISNTEGEAVTAALGAAKVGTKIAIMQITQVVCAQLTAQPATL